MSINKNKLDNYMDWTLSVFTHRQLNIKICSKRLYLVLKIKIFFAKMTVYFILQAIDCSVECLLILINILINIT